MNTPSKLLDQKEYSPGFAFAATLDAATLSRSHDSAQFPGGEIGVVA